MYESQFLETIYDILAQNEVTKEDRNHVTEHIDHIDYDSKEKVFINPKNNKQYSLTITER